VRHLRRAYSASSALLPRAATAAQRGDDLVEELKHTLVGFFCFNCCWLFHVFFRWIEELPGKRTGVFNVETST